jgi:hypothetical protein
VPLLIKRTDARRLPICMTVCLIESKAILLVLLGKDVHIQTKLLGDFVGSVER